MGMGLYGVWLGLESFGFEEYSRKILGWKVATSLRTVLALDAFNMTIYQRPREEMDTRGLVHHSDRGVQYRDVRYGQAVAECKAVTAIGSTGDPYIQQRLNRSFELLVQSRTHLQQGAPWLYRFMARPTRS